jgi:GT2 family glycosyltransferase/glycosyltransferase involved in cell wall biosynthesis
MPPRTGPTAITLLGHPDRHREGLLSLAIEAISAGDPAGGLRYADRARRLKPDDATIAQLCARLLGRLGRPRSGLALLGRCPSSDATPAGGLLRAGLLLAAGDPEAAAEVLATLLGLFAADALPGVGDLATAICRHPASPRRGWIGFAADGRLVGEPAPEGRPDPLHAPAIIGAAALRWPPAWRADGEAALAVGVVRGWVRLGWAPGQPLTVLLEGPDGEAVRTVTHPDTDAEGRVIQAFSISAPPAWAAGKTSLAALLPNGVRWPIPRSGARPCLAAARQPRRRTPTRRISIVVPVYAGVEETLACLRSALETTDRERVELIVVYDCGPEPELLTALEGLSARGLITLLVNAENSGFPASVNRGMALRPDQDVVLLNADAEVFGDWLRRLSVAAYSSDDIATVTPFSNSASITSYPSTEDCECDSARAIELDRLFSEYRDETVVDLPTGVGFCLYIKRQCLAEVGCFEEDAFGPGYGEENDFCLRATAAGWRHVAAPNVFVRHIGGRSFGTLKELLIENNLRVLGRRHPGYADLIARFVERDPLHQARRWMDGRLIGADRRPITLVITLGRDGGVRRYVENRKKALEAAGGRVLELRPTAERLAGGVCRLVSTGDPFRDLTYQLPQESGEMLGLLGALPIERVEIHHFLGLDPCVLEIPDRLGAPYDIVVHDYTWICPRITLTGGDKRYCGEPDLASCEACVGAHGGRLEEEISVSDLRARSGRLFRRASSVTVSCGDVSRRLRRYFPDVTPRVTPWEDTVAGPAPSISAISGRARVALIGGIGEHKGYRRLLECARDAAARDLPIDFVVIGFTEDDHALFDTGRVFVTGRFEDDEVADLLERERCNVVFFPSIAPETWSYALSHGLRSGLPIVAFEFGAVAERLRGVDRARLLSPDSDPKTLNDALTGAAGPAVSVALRTRDRGDAWIEGFRIDLAGAGAGDIHYSALVGDRDQTRWVAKPAWCADPAGVRPLMGFAVRLDGALAGAFRCEYAGTFSSGAEAAAAEGALCCSPTPNDPLVGMTVTLAPHSVRNLRTEI